MSQASERIAQQYAAAGKTRRVWGEVIYNILDYEGVGDGNENDSPHFAALVTLIGTQKATILLPKGTYRCGTPVTFPSNITLMPYRGAVLKPDNGIVVTLNCSINVGLYDFIFDVSTGGSFVGSPKVGKLSPQWFGADSTGVAYSSDAINAAAILASNAISGTTTGATMVVPCGQYRNNKQLVFKNVSLEADPHGTTFIFEELGDGVYAIIIDRDAGKRHPSFHNLSVIGPGFYQLGTKTTTTNGVKVIGQASAYFQNCYIQKFANGFDCGNDVGHIKFHNVWVTQNYYGVYVSKNTGDYSFSQCHINENNFANIATNATQGIDGLSMRDCHCGFAPIAFYCEPAPNGVGGKNLFLWDVNLDHVRFESIGNAAFLADYSQGATPTVSSLRIIQPGFTWALDKDTRFYWDQLPHDYAMDFVRVEGGQGIEIIGDTYPFTKGVIAVMRVRQQNGAPIIIKQRNALKTEYIIEGGTGTGVAGNLLQVGYTDALLRSDGQMIANSYAGVQKTLADGVKSTFSIPMNTNTNKRAKYLVMADFSQDAVAEVWSTGAALTPMFVGSAANVSTTETAVAGKMNVYLNGNNIEIKNLLGSSRVFSIIAFPVS